MSLLTATPADLPHLVRAHAKVLATVAHAESAASARLRPVFELFATNRAYAGIAFAWLPDISAAPAGLLLTAPFFCAFAQERLVYGDSLSSEQQVRGVLQALHAHAWAPSRGRHQQLPAIGGDS
ncbi:hypothetical protein [Hymenobacter coccineus]|uniref:Uncharacterized protein n=1 Tax=Hymenobacter coccineus TaxID=1908235 RepID=A0A1G1TJ33_9BACT|nr:hypothetical protein [Hymenobacter coccineus]OGX90876.1 hypothetical protein BEN49_06005 [Hymenobacter coccineus]